MATQTSASSSPTAQVVGNAFVEQYYHILHSSPHLVYRFYQDTSALSRPDPNGHMVTVSTMKDINEKICSVDYKNYKAEIKTADAQESLDDGVIVLVTGVLTTEDNLRKKFAQTFFLAPQDKGFYVLNDVFRYLDESEPEDVNGVAGAVEDTPSNVLNAEPEPAEAVEPPSVQDETLPPAEVETTAEEKSHHHVVEEIQSSNDKEIAIESESHASENHIAANEESVISESPQDAPKKSYASILSSQTKKGPTKTNVPASSSKAVPAKIQKPSADQVGEASGPEASKAVVPANASDSKDVHDDVEGYSIYVRNLPLNVTVSQLESEFIKFGPIKQNGVQVRSNKDYCFGFVEFLDFNSMQSAIKTSSPVIIGGQKASMEIKRTATRVGKGRYSASRGNFRSDSFRGGRGNFSGGRTYVRSDSFRGGRGGGGNFNNGARGGEGYQQGRGRGGGRRPGPTQNPSSE